MAWHRIVVDDSDFAVTGHFVDAGSRLIRSGHYERGMSIWQIDSTNALAGEPPGRRPSARLQDMPLHRVEIYLAPGTKEAMSPNDLAGFTFELCDRPPQDDVALLVGDQRDLTTLWK